MHLVLVGNHYKGTSFVSNLLKNRNTIEYYSLYLIFERKYNFWENGKQVTKEYFSAIGFRNQ